VRALLASSAGAALTPRRTLQLGARWTVFDTPLRCVIHVGAGRGRLADCVLCAAADGSVAVVALDGLLLCVPSLSLPIGC
jgi:hypothetical protein